MAPPDRVVGRNAASGVGLAAAAALCFCLPARAAPASASCERLASASLPYTTITAAESIPAGSYTPAGSKTTFTNLPAFCRIAATVSPVPGSAIGIEVWLPTTTWNGRYQQVGNHGFSGTIYFSEMAPQLQRGFATGGTNDGHGGPGGFNVSWAFNNPVAITDLAYRAVHELAATAKLIIKHYYGRPQEYAYFNGCSNGGREAVKEAQMFPTDFNGIIAGGVARFWTRAATEQLVLTLNLQNAGITGPAGAAVLNLTQAATTATCDALDGVVDGLISDPRRCHWDPYTLVCKPGQAAGSCITPQQAQAVQLNESPLRDPVTGRYLFAGQAPGSEFDQLRFGDENGPAPFGVANYQIALNDPSFNGEDFDRHAQLPILDHALGLINATNTNLRPFEQSGGKLIEWQGWDDAAFAPDATVDYYGDVVDQTAGGNLKKLQQFYRLFMLPGVGHCGTGIGPDNFGEENYIAVSHDPQHDVVTALEDWVEHGVAPNKFIVSQFANDNAFPNNNPTLPIVRQRPICAYPAEAVYLGSGDINAATSFVCWSPLAPE